MDFGFFCHQNFDFNGMRKARSSDKYDWKFIKENEISFQKFD